MPPRCLGAYEVLSVIGRGGVGTVYRGRHRLTGQLAAVKVLGPAPAVDPTAARRLAREFEVLRALEHPNVVRVFDAGVAEGYSYLAMELVDGLDLRAYLSPALDETATFHAHEEPLSAPPWDAPDEETTAEHGAAAIRALAAMMDEPDTEPEHAPLAHPLSADGTAPEPPPPLSPEAQEALNRPRRIERVLVSVRQVLGGLAYVHGEGLVHRDLKPSNIMVDDARRARLMDFGLVKAAGDLAAGDEPLTATGRVVGTYRYMSPEQAQGHPVDPRSDLYSVGVILYELLAGRTPFIAHDPVELWREILHDVPPPIASLNPGADRRLAAVSERLLSKDPAARFPTAEAVLDALR